jgi:hypothetical protein
VSDKNRTIDVDILDMNGNRVDGDDGTAPTIKFRPAKSATYRLKVALKETIPKGDKPRGGFCTLVFLRKGGYDLPVTNIRTSLETVIQASEEVNKLAKDTVLFQSGNNQWAMYGAVLEQGEAMTITKLKLGKGERMLVAGGDKNAEDVDVYVVDEDGDTLAKDKGRDPFAFVKFTEDEDKFRGLKFKNTKSKRGGPTLVLTAVLTLNN